MSSESGQRFVYFHFDSEPHSFERPSILLKGRKTCANDMHTCWSFVVAAIVCACFYGGIT